uniref:Plastid lipid-associated protein/fibrillin conserved domain-containing protein n=1 Tax=Chromera velia CCMP2878 TaxID=1169474 RepID=A0A0G4HFS1_9ALVE|mmetsp:Transcript_48786/g.96245  ORF Transcript_48786/g.96245 Transcript_48786/m.96245 type:complete len:263 (+) Transcript_48786:221-1009(+)|eukprot:Cvel_26984.t1-p1 / transcript=Cvel_26984.t1 / gene=Cvel_26984 / organism=Chromera_velia_CCMP2878 / gene_product=Probable plastid-lipid-associated protein 4,, putative / transcript_product=Probable plastid-lipid-associated protein 4,, putative / location=Cvel_scaffold3295:6355-12158(+) / protein_length=262 / sequence_SO=supercontig / SO=protein_coding / is_pseudo=false
MLFAAIAVLLGCAQTAGGFVALGRRMKGEAREPLLLDLRSTRRSGCSTQVAMIFDNLFKVPSPSGSSAVKGTKTKQLLEDLLEAIEEERGDGEITEIFEKVERAAPKGDTLKSKDLSCKWRLLWTTSEGIRGSNRPPFFRPKKGSVFQVIDVANLRAENREAIQPLPFVQYENKVTAKLTPDGSSFVRVKFLKFSIGPLTVGGLRLGPVRLNAPEFAVGALNVTYVDDRLRLSRGDKGNLFVLEKAEPLPPGGLPEEGTNYT